MMRLLIALIILLVVPITGSRAAEVYLTPSEALRILFKDSHTIRSEKKTLSEAQKKWVEQKLGSRLNKSEWTFFVAQSGEKIDGYALMDHEIGKVEPITFMLAIKPDGAIQALEILVYRETHGGEIRDEKFRKQFAGKTTSSALSLTNDIKHISGATLSSRAMTVGAKRVLAIWQVFYGK